jgi:hypothetical protein
MASLWALMICRRINYKLLNRPRWMGDPLASAQARVETNKGLFTSR